MDKKIGFLAVISVAALMASGCSSFRGGSQGAYGSDDYGSGSGASQVSGSGQVARSGQVANDSATTGTTTRRNRWFGQQYRDTTSTATCKPCATAPKPAAQNTYTYRPAPKPKTVTRPAAKPAGQYNQQYYIDRWNRQQQQANKPAPKPANTSTYTGYGSGNYDAGNQSSSTYYDYSSASGTKSTAPTSTSNKSIYTGSYQQKTYKPYNPTTYAGGTAATKTTTNTSSTVVSSGGGSTYTVRKGDTVFEIMRQTGVYWKDIISINNLQPPYNISPGQIIRLK